MQLPFSFSQAARRGASGKCPRCGVARLFRSWLRPVDTCAACHHDWSKQTADDFPAYVSIFVTGHVMAPLMIYLALEVELDALTSAMIIVPLACVIMFGILQPAKGAIIATQWWNGMSGFVKERPINAEVKGDDDGR